MWVPVMVYKLPTDSYTLVLSLIDSASNYGVASVKKIFVYNPSIDTEFENSIYGFTTGAGIAYDLGGDFGFVFDYAFREVKEFPSSNHVFTVKMAFQ